MRVVLFFQKNIYIIVGILVGTGFTASAQPTFLTKGETILFIIFVVCMIHYHYN